MHVISLTYSCGVGEGRLKDYDEHNCAVEENL